MHRKWSILIGSERYSGIPDTRIAYRDTLRDLTETLEPGEL